MVDSLNVLVTWVQDSANMVASSAHGIAASGTEMSTSIVRVLNNRTSSIILWI